jgi:MinD superfamily P-loop ATPase
MYSIQKRSHKAVERAVAKGLLVRPSLCDGCGNTCKPHAHHDDYSKPLNVMWLCSSCHAVKHPGNRTSIASRIANDMTIGAIY